MKPQMKTDLHCLKSIYDQKVMNFEDDTNNIIELAKLGLKISHYIEYTFAEKMKDGDGVLQFGY
uniref:Uncharacterized protein n=1 Tax=Rhizophora mucronata TaxID=61149 RepID=A0A2P2N1W1_RHIMU